MTKIKKNRILFSLYFVKSKKNSTEKMKNQKIYHINNESKKILKFHIKMPERRGHSIKNYAFFI